MAKSKIKNSLYRVIAPGGVYVRKEPKLEALFIGTLEFGTEFEAFEEFDNWLGPEDGLGLVESHIVEPAYSNKNE